MTDDFVNRGIRNSKADLWAHFFPKKYILYWYLVRHMREHIKENKPPITVGRSKNGNITGRGYLIRNDLPFINSYAMPAKYVDHFDWENLTDREAGLVQGEKVLDWWLNCSGKIKPGLWVVHPIRSKEGQYDIGDYQLEYRARPSIELKTELAESSNLYVQTAEYLHDVHTTAGGQRKVIKAPDFEPPF